MMMLNDAFIRLFNKNSFEFVLQQFGILDICYVRIHVLVVYFSYRPFNIAS